MDKIQRNSSFFSGNLPLVTHIGEVRMHLHIKRKVENQSKHNFKLGKAPLPVHMSNLLIKATSQTWPKNTPNIDKVTTDPRVDAFKDAPA